MNFNKAPNYFNSRHFKTRMKKMPAQANFCLLLNVFILSGLLFSACKLAYFCLYRSYLVSSHRFNFSIPTWNENQFRFDTNCTRCFYPLLSCFYLTLHYTCDSNTLKRTLRTFMEWGPGLQTATTDTPWGPFGLYWPHDMIHDTLCYGFWILHDFSWVRTGSCVRKLWLTHDWHQPWEELYLSAWDNQGH